MIDLITLLFLIVLSLIISNNNKLFSNIFLLIGGVLSFGGITTTQISSITTTTINYVTMHETISYAVGIVLIGIAMINYMNMIGEKINEKKQDEW